MKHFFLFLTAVATAANTANSVEVYTNRVAPWSNLGPAKCDGLADFKKVTITGARTAEAYLDSQGSVQVSGHGDAGDTSQVAGELETNVTEVIANYNAFAALKSDGSVVTWGQQDVGGDNTAAQAAIGGEHVLQLFTSPDSYAFAALLSTSKKLVVWGHPNLGGDSSAVDIALASGVVTMVFNEQAGAALKDDGSVHTWGSLSHGGDSSSIAGDISSGVTHLVASFSGFAATKADGTVISWGAGTTQVISLGPVQHLVGTDYAFAALLSDGSVTTWGDSSYGGDTSSVATDLMSGVIQLVAGSTIFAALKEDGEVISWGGVGGYDKTNLPQLDPGLINVTKLVANKIVAAIHTDGKLTTFGWSDSISIVSVPVLPPVQDVIPLAHGIFQVVTNETRSAIQTLLIGEYLETLVFPCDIQDIVTVVASSKAFAGITVDGTVKTWGSTIHGGYSDNVVEQLQDSVVVNITSSFAAFAALTKNGSVITWGDPEYGGDSSQVAHLITNDVKAIFSNTYAFAALKYDGSVISWGHPTYGGISGSITDVVHIVGGKEYFAAYKSDGTVVTWGGAGCGDTSSVALQLTSSVKEVIHNQGGGCAILKDDTSVVTWGIASSALSIGYLPFLTSGFVEVVASYHSFAALKDDNTVVSWGYFGGIDYTTKFFSDVRKIVANKEAFAAIHLDGSVSAWGASHSGGTINAFASELQSGVIDVISSQDSNTFAALQEGGRLVCWGYYDSLEFDSQIQQDVVDVVMNAGNIAVLKANGQVITWGHPQQNGDSTSVVNWLQDKVVSVHASGASFAALRSDGVAVAWGVNLNSYEWMSDEITKTTDSVVYNVTDIVHSRYASGQFSAIVQSVVATNSPTQAPTSPPTQAPTSPPTQAPTNTPTQTPTSEAQQQTPTVSPTLEPTPLRFHDGSEYSGGVNIDNQMNGYGELEFLNGNKLRGYFKNGKRDNTGEFIRADGHTQSINWAEPQITMKPGYAREAPPVTLYLGCVADGPLRDLNYLAFSIDQEHTDSDTNIITECELICRQGAFWFFGLQEGNKCYCGNDYGRLEVYPGDPLFRDESECNYLCSGALAGTGLKCGGPWRNSVFRIGIEPLVI